MPKPPRRESGSLGSFLQEMLGSAFDFVGEHVQDVAPKCALCGELAIPLRCACGRYACKDHGYFNIVLGRAICPVCAMSLGAPVEASDEDEDEDEPVERPAPRAQRRRHRQRQPGAPREATAIAWDMLGLDPAGATAADVNKAYRQAARECHPDRHPGDAHAARRFKALQRARDLCLADLEARREG